MYRLAFAICLVLLSCGCNYIGATAGPCGEFEATSNFTFEYGFRSSFEDHTKTVSHDPSGDPVTVPSKRDVMLTAGVLVIDNGIDTWFFNSNPEMGGFLKLGVEVAPDTGFFVNVLGGLTWIHWASCWDEGTEWYGLIGGGVTYFINDKDICLIAAYDNRRFFNAGVGVRF